jgi:hypothetical protein
MSRLFVLAAVLASLTSSAPAQPSYPPPNAAPNPYLPGVSWGQLPAGVDIAPDGTI